MTQTPKTSDDLAALRGITFAGHGAGASQDRLVTSLLRGAATSALRRKLARRASVAGKPGEREPISWRR